jgi:hypothetical protein
MNKCGYCDEKPVAWIEWATIGRPKGAPVCERHLYEMDKLDNFGNRIKVDWLV